LGAQNSRAEINLESTVLMSNCNLFFGKKLANTCSCVGNRINVHHDKISREERSLTNPVNAL
jgi:hypothetical protein